MSHDLSPEALRHLIRDQNTNPAQERWAAHEATAKELAKIEVQLVELNTNIKELINAAKVVLGGLLEDKED